MDLMFELGFRVDGRKHNELRKLSCKLGVFKQPDGSAYLEQGNTKVLAAVYGPHEVRRNRGRILHDRAIVNCQYSMATFSTTDRKLRPRGDRKSQEFTQLLKKCFETAIQVKLYPRSQIDIFCEILQSDGGNLSTCINAATLAIIDAGIPMRDYVTSVTCGWINEKIVVDVSGVEESSSSSSRLTIAILPRSEDLVLVELQSRLHAGYLEKLMDAGVKACKDVHVILDEAVRNYCNKTANSLGW